MIFIRGILSRRRRSFVFQAPPTRTLCLFSPRSQQRLSHCAVLPPHQAITTLHCTCLRLLCLYHILAYMYTGEPALYAGPPYTCRGGRPRKVNAYPDDLCRERMHAGCCTQRRAVPLTLHPVKPVSPRYLCNFKHQSVYRFMPYRSAPLTTLRAPTGKDFFNEIASGASLPRSYLRSFQLVMFLHLLRPSYPPFILPLLLLGSFFPRACTLPSLFTYFSAFFTLP